MTDGAAYDPATDTWITLTTPPLPPAPLPVAVWTGTEVLVWERTAGAAFDPARDTWRTMPDAPVHGTVAVWSGTELLLPARAAYDPAIDSWRTTGVEATASAACRDPGGLGPPPGRMGPLVP